MESITKVFSDLVKPYIDASIQNLSNLRAEMGAHNLLSISDNFSFVVPSGGGDVFGTGVGTAIETIVSGDYYFSFNFTASAQAILRLYDITGTQIYQSNAFSVSSGRTEVMFTVSSDIASIKLYVNAAGTVTKTMIRRVDDNYTEYQPYSKTNQQLTKETTGLMDNQNVNGAVNMLPNFRETVVDSGITYTVNVNKSVTCNGTATANNHLEPVKTSDNYYLQAGTYKLTGCPSGGTDDTYYQRLYNLNSSAIQIGRDYGDGLVFTLTESTRIGMQIQFISGTTASNLTFKPMITVASYTGDYVPFAKSNKELTDDVNNLFDRFGLSFKVIAVGTISNSSKTITVNTTIAGLLATYHSGNAEAYDSLHMVSCTLSEVPAVKTIASASNITLDLTEAGKITVTNSGSGGVSVFLLLFRGTATIS